MSESIHERSETDDSEAAADEATADEAAAGRDDLVASLWPWAGDDSTPAVEIVVYVVTGTHGGLTIPERFCRECHRFVRAADVAAERVDVDVEVTVRSWWTHLPFALRHGGYHAPVMVVGGKRLCQGYDVPTVDEVVAAVEEARR